MKYTHPLFSLFYKFDVDLSRTGRFLLLYSKILLAGTLSLIFFYTEMQRTENGNFAEEIGAAVAVSIIGSLLLMPFPIITEFLLFEKTKKEQDNPPGQIEPLEKVSRTDHFGDEKPPRLFEEEKKREDPRYCEN